MKKRIARIYPTFAICSLLLILLVGPLVGGHHSHGFISEMMSTLYRIFTLRMPTMPGTFGGTPYPLLNGAA